MRKRILLAGILSLTCAAAAFASDAVEQRISKSLQAINPQLKAQGVSKTPVPGLYEAIVGGQIYYFSEDGRYMVQGEMIDLTERESVTEPRRKEIRLNQLATVKDKDLLIYPAKGPRKHVVSVFTDIDCPYCRKLHEHMEEMNAKGIEVRYLLMPRTGIGSPSYVKAVNVWCAAKPNEAMTAAKRGQAVPEKDCPNPVKQHMALAQEMGVNATPTIVTSNGSLMPGYLPPDELLARLQAEEADAAPRKRAK